MFTGRNREHSRLAAARKRIVNQGRPGGAGQCRRVSLRATINGRAVDVKKLTARGFGLRAIARELNMPPSSVLKALRLAA